MMTLNKVENLQSLLFVLFGLYPELQHDFFIGNFFTFSRVVRWLFMNKETIQSLQLIH